MKFFDFVLSLAALISLLVASYLFANETGLNNAIDNLKQNRVDLKKTETDRKKDNQNHSALAESTTTKWKYIVIHHSSTPSGNAKIFDRYHREDMKMADGLAYHFVIGNGTKSGDGEVEVGSRWQKQITGPHCFDGVMNEHAIGICLVGDFEKGKPTPVQMKALEELLKKLLKDYNIPPAQVVGHNEVDKGKTDCPGKNFPITDLRRRLK